MIDIHTHILPEVDDGSDSVEKSVEMVKLLMSQGVDEICLTPHYRGEHKCSPKMLKDKFDGFKKVLSDSGIDVKLHLGQEIFVEESVTGLLDEKKVLSVDDGKCVMVEFPYKGNYDVSETVYELKCRGYIPIVVHVERYNYLHTPDLYDIKDAGGYIQVNSSSVIGKGNKSKRRVNKWIKEGLVDFVASDIHYGRVSYMDKAYKHVAKKFGRRVAERLFDENFKELIKG